MDTIRFILFPRREQSLLQGPAAGFLVSQITTSQWTKTCRIVIDINHFIHIYDIVKRREISGPGPRIYLSVQIIFVLSEGEHLHLKTFEVGEILNPFVQPNGMEDHLVGVHWVWTP